MSEIDITIDFMMNFVVRYLCLHFSKVTYKAAAIWESFTKNLATHYFTQSMNTFELSSYFMRRTFFSDILPPFDSPFIHREYFHHDLSELA